MKANISKKIHVWLQNFLKKGRGELINPLRAWATGLFSAITLLIIGLTIMIVDFYIHVSPQNTSSNEAPKQTITYPAEEIKKYAEEYSKRVQVFNDLRSQVPAYVPPVVETVLEVDSQDQSTTTDETVAEEPTDG